MQHAVVDAENDWRWFLETLHSIIECAAPEFIDPGNLETGLTFLSDRQKGLLEGVVLLFSQSAHGYCMNETFANISSILLWSACCGRLQRLR